MVSFQLIPVYKIKKLKQNSGERSRVTWPSCYTCAEDPSLLYFHDVACLPFKFILFGILCSQVNSLNIHPALTLNVWITMPEQIV